MFKKSDAVKHYSHTTYPNMLWGFLILISEYIDFLNLNYMPFHMNE